MSQPNSDSSSIYEFEGGNNEQKSTTVGVLLMLLAGFVFSVVAALFQWGSALGYQSMQLVIMRSILQLSLAVVFGLTTFSKPIYSENSGLNESQSESSNNTNITKQYSNSTSNCRIHCKAQQFKQEVSEMSRNLWFWVALRGIIGGLGTCFQVHAITVLPLGDATAVFRFAFFLSFYIFVLF